MSDAPDTLATLRDRERSLEMDAAVLTARLEEVRGIIATLEHPRRRGRPRKVWVAGDAATDADPPEAAA